MMRRYAGLGIACLFALSCPLRSADPAPAEGALPAPLRELERQLTRPLIAAVQQPAQRAAAMKESLDALLDLPALARAIAGNRGDALAPSLRLRTASSPVPLRLDRPIPAQIPSQDFSFSLRLASRSPTDDPLWVHGRARVGPGGTTIEIIDALPSLNINRWLPMITAGCRWSFGEQCVVSEMNGWLREERSMAMPREHAPERALLSLLGTYGLGEAAAAAAIMHAITPEQRFRAEVRGRHADGLLAALSWARIDGAAGAEAELAWKDRHAVEIVARTRPERLLLSDPSMTYEEIINKGMPDESRRTRLLEVPVDYPGGSRRWMAEATIGDDGLLSSAHLVISDDEGGNALLEGRLWREIGGEGGALEADDGHRWAMRLADELSSAPPPDGAHMARLADYIAAAFLDDGKRSTAHLAAAAALAIALNRRDDAQHALDRLTEIAGRDGQEGAWIEREQMSRYAWRSGRHELALLLSRPLPALFLALPEPARTALGLRHCARGHWWLAGVLSCADEAPAATQVLASLMRRIYAGQDCTKEDGLGAAMITSRFSEQGLHAWLGAVMRLCGRMSRRPDVPEGGAP